MDQQDSRPDSQQPEESAGATAGREPGEHLAGAPADNPMRYGAPLPPPPLMRPPVAAPVEEAASATPASPRRRGPRLAAAGTALAVLAVAGGAGYALGRLESHTQPAASGGPGVSGQGPDGQGFGDSPFGGQQPGGTPFGGAGGAGGMPFDSTSSGTPASGSQLTGLVRIASTLKYEGGRAAGTGMILTSSGEVVTNHHVVQGSTKLRVTVVATGRSYQASVVGTDAKDDIAVLQLKNASGLATVTTGTAVTTGQTVTAVGDAGGSTAHLTAAKGTVLATGQNITTSSEDGRSSERLSGLIKISSDVISGDSGGATYDAQGQVVGMTTAASTGSPHVVGYAIPISKVERIAGALENGTQNARYDYGSPAFLGVGLGGTTTRVGLVYPHTPAARAGITAGDTITRVQSTRVHTPAQLRRAITAYSPGDQVRLTWTDPSGLSHLARVTLMAGPIA